MIDKPIYNLRTIRYLLTQQRQRLGLPAITYNAAVQLVDVSKWQGQIDFVRMVREGIAGVILKAGQADYPDPNFSVNWVKAGLAGLPRGTYFFFDSRKTPEVQAQTWANLVRGLGAELMHFADFEENYGGPYGGWQNFKLFLKRFQELTGLPDSKIGIYTGYYYWIGHVPISEMDWFGRFRLWLPWYAAASVVKIPRPWTQETLLFWQFTDSGPGYDLGVSSAEIDLNYWVNGDLAHFLNFFKLTPLPPPEDTPMSYLKITSTDSLSGRSLRADHIVTSAKIGSMPGTGTARANLIDVYTHPGDVFSGTTKVAAAGDRWVHVFEMDGAPVIGWMAEIHLGARLLNVEIVNTGTLPVLSVSLKAPGYPDLNIDWKPL